MIFPAIYVQNLDPFGNTVLSTIVASLPIIVLFWVLVPMRRPAPLAGFLGALTAIVVACLAFGMNLSQAGLAFLNGAGFGLLPVGWTILNAMLLYNVTVETGQFAIIRRSVAGLSPDARIQAILVAFCFGAFLEGAAGGGTPVAICGAIMVGLGFDPFKAAVLCLIANTSPVAYGGLGTPIITLSTVTDLPTAVLSTMAGHQLPFLSCVIPIWMVRCMCSWRETWDVWPALVVAGGSFALFQFIFATIHNYVPALVVYPMTDIGGGIFSLLVMALFLRHWQPPSQIKYAPPAHHAVLDKNAPALSTRAVCRAWMPFAIMSVFMVITGFIRQMEAEAPVTIGPIQTNYKVPIPGLHEEVARAERLRKDPQVIEREKAEFNLAWLTSPGSPALAAALVSMLLLRVTGSQVVSIVRRTIWQMRIPIPTIAFMLGLSYVTRFSGMDATLGVAFANTGALYPFFAAILGWLGVFLTGTDAGSNALFGSLQKITATEVYRTDVFSHLSLDQTQILICTANSTGGVMGKMIDAQSICVATAATDQVGKEASIFKAVVWHSIILAAIVGLMTLGQAYVVPFTRMVPGIG